MASYTMLPKKAKDVAETVQRWISDAAPIRNAAWVDWRIAYYYLQGIRDFTALDRTTGTIKFRYTRAENRGFKLDLALTKLQAEIGRLLKIDLRPLVKQRHMTLDSVRKASISTVALDYLFPETQLDRVKLEFIPAFLTYGVMGIAMYEDRRGDGEGDENVWPTLEVVPPWELLPVPADPVVASDLRGLIRTRKVPLSWLRQIAPIPRKDSELYKKMEIYSGPFGERQTMDGDPNAQAEEGTSTLGLSFYEKGGDAMEGQEQEYVRINELWLWDNDSVRRTDRYVVTSGDATLFDKDYSKEVEKPPVPIAVAAHTRVGGFYARSFVDPLLGLNSELEGMLGAAFKNVRDLDNFGFVCIPSTLGMDMAQFKRTQRPRIITYEPDHSAQQDLKPFSIQPTNSGMAPAKIMELGLGVFNQLTQQSELLQGEAPGRVESARGLGLLFETSAIPLGGPVLSVATAFSQVYAAALYSVRTRWTTKKIASVTLLDESVIGLRVDTTTGEIGLADNAVPDPAEVTITIRSRYPQSPEQRRADLDDQLAKQIITPRDYRILARKHNLDLPVANDAEWNNYCQSVYNNIKLFGDGSTSSGDYEVRDNELHEIHLERLLAFMSRTEFQFASEDVTRAFEQAVTARRERLGILPEPLAYPEDAAAEMQMQMGGPGGPMGPGGPGGPGPMGPGPQGPQGLPPELMGGPGMPMPPQPPPVQ